MTSVKRPPDPAPEAAGNSSQTADEPAQGRVDTQTRYRDRPTDDGKYGDAEHGDAKRGDAKRGDAKRGDAKRGAD